MYLLGWETLVKYLRQKVVKDVWKAEKRLVERTGCGSRRRTKKELKELKETGKVKGYEGHHINSNSVKGHPEDAGDPSNIEFVKKGGEHLSRHNGNYRNPSSGKKINRD
ncbi:hypothetical protein [Prevotella melaninogenica]|uniref:hypothetical protein n=1 Tax=Prevotella melaninogenica TaxID=28132 RepID=UPI0020130C9F|nr:hypothetical protein [Prevotella melaninogenica]